MARSDAPGRDASVPDHEIALRLAQMERRVHQGALQSEIGAAFTRASDARDMLQRSTDAIVRHLDAAFARIWTTDDSGEVLELQSSSGMYTHIDGGHARVPVGKFKIGLIAAERAPHLRCAGGVAEALATFADWRPEVVVSDVGMPGEDGHSLVQRIRALPAAEGGRTPAIALTAYTRMEDRTRALLAGFTLHLAKPIEPSVLLSAVATVAGRLRNTE